MQKINRCSAPHKRLITVYFMPYVYPIMTSCMSPLNIQSIHECAGSYLFEQTQAIVPKKSTCLWYVRWRNFPSNMDVACLISVLKRPVANHHQSNTIAYHHKCYVKPGLVGSTFTRFRVLITPSGENGYKLKNLNSNSKDCCFTVSIMIETGMRHKRSTVVVTSRNFTKTIN